MFSTLKSLSKPGGQWSSLSFLCLFAFAFSACGGASSGTGNVPAASSGGSAKVIHVVAAENFYGDIVAQLGGSHVAVTSVLSDPNVDPHTYESSVQTGISVSNADFVIENGGGYDDWMDKLLSGSPNSSRKLLKGYDVAPTHLPNNEHVWYSIENVGAIAQSITSTLKQIDAANAATFDTNLHTFQSSLDQIKQKIAEVKSKYNGTPVGLTETIYLYQTQPEGLNVLTPFEFQKSIAEGNDPPADTVATAVNQINGHQIKLLIYNQQTVTPVTTNLQTLAKSKNIPIVPVTETMPPGKTYQTWMIDQLTALENALSNS